MDIELIKMSSKGQVVIPQKVRDSLNAKEGTVFAVLSTTDTVLLKKIQTPSKDELLRSIKSLAQQNTQALKKAGMSEKDVIEKSLKGRQAAV